MCEKQKKQKPNNKEDNRKKIYGNSGYQNYETQTKKIVYYGLGDKSLKVETFYQS